MSDMITDAEAKEWRRSGGVPTVVNDLVARLLADRERHLKAAEAVDSFVPDHDHADLGEFAPDDCPFCDLQAILREAGRLSVDDAIEEA
ncbi:MAG TPA: hypothetical protein VJM51_01405 [Dehalococcoidia bacterium]|nr:hypothetical protein [Dehalococcoidia bacterium]